MKPEKCTSCNADISDYAEGSTLCVICDPHVDNLPFIFTCVNEDGQKYDEFTDANAALKMLEEFPNDFIIVTVGRKGVKHLLKQLNQ